MLGAVRLAPADVDTLRWGLRRTLEGRSLRSRRTVTARPPTLEGAQAPVTPSRGCVGQ